MKCRKGVQRFSCTPDVHPMTKTVILFAHPINQRAPNMQFIEGKREQLNNMATSANVAGVLESRINWSSSTGVWCTITDICNAVGIKPEHKTLRVVAEEVRRLYPNAQRKTVKGKRYILIPGELVEAEQ